MPSHYTIKELPEHDRPRERMLKGGSGVMRDAELLAILLGGGYQEVSALDLAQQMLNELGGLARLTTMELRELMKVKGIGLAKACSLRAAFELGRRMGMLDLNDRIQVSSPEEAAAFLMPKYGDRDREHVGIIALDVKNKVIEERVITVGILDGSMIHPREIYKPALSASAASIILFHNHPSGDTTPSRKDIDVTTRIAEAGKTLGIDLVDHIIVSRARFTSLKKQGLM